MRIGLGIGTTIGRAGGGAPPSEPGMLTGRLAHYLDGSTPYHSGPTSNKYFVRDVSGNGRHAPVKTPCLRGYTGATPYCSINTHTLTGDFEYQFWMQWIGSTTNPNGPMMVGGGFTAGGSSYRNYLWYRPSTNTWTLTVDGESTRLSVVNSTIEDNKWHKIKVSRAGTTYKLFIDDAEVGSNTGTATTITLRQILLTYSTSYIMVGHMADFQLTYGGVTYYFPLQDGPGTSNTNRNIAWCASNGTGGVISNALVDGTVSDIWAAKCPGYAKDWSIEYGGKIGASGEFIAGLIGSGNAADGTAKTLAAGKFGNPYSSFDMTLWSQDLRDRNVASEYKVGQNINGQVIPAESAFRRTDTDGDDRILIYTAAKSGDVLDEVRTHTGETAQPTWTIDDLPDDVGDEYFAAITANGGSISANNQTAVRNLLNGLHTAGLYDDVFLLYLFHGNTLNAARLNAINPSLNIGAWPLTWVGSPTLNASGGITPSSGNYGVAANIDGMGLTNLSGAGLGFYSTSNAASSEHTIGHLQYFFLAPKRTTDSGFALSNVELTGTAQDLSGFHFASREPNSSNVAAYRNESAYITTTRVFTQNYIADTDYIHIGGCNDGSANLASTTPIRLAIVTNGLTAAQVDALNTLVQAYIGALV